MRTIVKVFSLNYVRSCIFKVSKAFLALTRLKSFDLSLFRMKPGTQKYLVYMTVFKSLDLKTIVICLKFRVKLRYLALLSFFGTYSLKVVQTWFVRHENNSHCLKLSAKFLRFPKLFGHSLA